MYRLSFPTQRSVPPVLHFPFLLRVGFVFAFAVVTLCFFGVRSLPLLGTAQVLRSDTRVFLLPLAVMSPSLFPRPPPPSLDEIFFSSKHNYMFPTNTLYPFSGRPVFSLRDPSFSPPPSRSDITRC